MTEAGAEFDVQPVNLRKAEQRSPEYLKRNPKHQVPTQVIDGEPLTEKVAIPAGKANARRRDAIRDSLAG